MTNASKKEIQIQKGLPPPPVIRERKEREPVWPFSKMAEVNDTFFAAGISSNTMQSAIRRFVKGPGKGCKFTLRTVAEVVPGQESQGEQQGVRVWRVE